VALSRTGLQASGRATHLGLRTGHAYGILVAYAKPVCGLSWVGPCGQCIVMLVCIVHTLRGVHIELMFGCTDMCCTCIPHPGSAVSTVGHCCCDDSQRMCTHLCAAGSMVLMRPWFNGGPRYSFQGLALIRSPCIAHFHRILHKCTRAKGWERPTPGVAIK
jgi:hypothetical protein